MTLFYRILAAVALPLAAVSLLVWALGDRTSTLNAVPVAVVNNDVPTTGSNPTAAGRALAGSLTNPPPGQANLDWTLTSSDQASAGLRDGSYYSVLTIPADFSKSVTSSSGNKPVQAQLTLTSNSASNALIGQISQQVTNAAATSLGIQVTQNYLGNVYDGFNKEAKSLSDAADNSKSVSDGTSQLAGAADQVNDSTKKLDNGLHQLHSGTGQLANSAADLAGGASSLSNGAGSLASASHQIDNGAQQLARGAGTEASGAEALQAGIARTDTGAHALARGVHGVADGAGGVAAGARGVARGADGVAAGARTVSEGNAGLDRAATGVDRLAGLTAGRAAALSGTLRALQRDCPRAPGDRLFCLRLRRALLQSAVVARGTGAVDTATGGIATAAGRLARGSAGVRAGASQVAAGAGRLSASAARLSAGAAGAASSADALAAGTSTLDRSAAQLADGAAGLSSSANHLAAGTSTLSTSADSLAASSSSLAGGASQLSSASKQIDQSAGQSAAGADSLAQGTDQLAASAHKVDNGAQSLTSGLQNGAKSAPTYTDDQQKALTKVVSQPVVVHTQQQHNSVDNAWLISAITGVVLWLGAFAGMLRRSRPAAAAALGPVSSSRLMIMDLVPRLLIAVAQAAVVLITLWLFGRHPTAPVAFGLFALLGAVSFTVIAAALQAVLPRVGPMIFLLFMLLQLAAAGTILPLQTAPGALQTVSGLLPLSAFINGGTRFTAGGVVQSVPAMISCLAGWAVAALIVIAIWSRRDRIVQHRGGFTRSPLVAATGR